MPEKRVKILMCETLDEIEKMVNDFAENHQVVDIKIRPGSAKKPWMIFVDYLLNPSDKGTKKIRVIFADKAQKLEDEMNMFNAFCHRL